MEGKACCIPAKIILCGTKSRSDLKNLPALPTGQTGGRLVLKMG